MFLIDELPEGGNVLSERAPVCPHRHKVRPLTWVVAAALVPLLGWDVWQTLQDVKHRHEVHASAMSPSPAAAARLRAHFE